MAEPFLSEIRLVSFNFAPRGWAQCNGQLLPINQNQALFSLLGTTFGGDGRVNFGLPDMRGRVAIHSGNGHTLGERGGEATHTVTMNEMPAHMHMVNMSNALATTANPSGAVIGKKGRLGKDVFAGAANTAVGPASTSAGGSQAHNNVQPVLGIMAVIALQGIFPSQN